MATTFLARKAGWLMVLIAVAVPSLAQVTSPAPRSITSQPMAAASDSGTTNSPGTSSGAALVAQVGSPPAATQGTQTSATATTAQAGTAPAEQLTEVTVTAERVAAPEQTIPIAMTAISGQQLTAENIVTPDQLRGLVPSLNILGQTGDGAGSLGENQMAILIRGTLPWS